MRVFFQREQKHRRRLVQTSGENMTDPNSHRRRGRPSRVQPATLFEVLDAKIDPPGP
jgi:hypothetical protein